MQGPRKDFAHENLSWYMLTFVQEGKRSPNVVANQEGILSSCLPDWDHAIANKGEGAQRLVPNDKNFSNSLSRYLRSAYCLVTDGIPRYLGTVLSTLEVHTP